VNFSVDSSCFFLLVIAATTLAIIPELHQIRAAIDSLRKALEQQSRRVDRKPGTGAWSSTICAEQRPGISGAGIAETVIMKIGGWRTRSVFERYAIVSRNDIVDAMRKLRASEAHPEISHEISHAANAAPTEATSQRVN